MIVTSSDDRFWCRWSEEAKCEDVLYDCMLRYPVNPNERQTPLSLHPSCILLPVHSSEAAVTPPQAEERVFRPLRCQGCQGLLQLLLLRLREHLLC